MAIKKNKTPIKDINYYLRLKWTYTIEEELLDGKSYYVVHVNELPGVCSDGETLEEAMQNAKEAMRGAFKLYIKQGDAIPEPIHPDQFPGKISYRTSSHRHYLLAKEAHRRKKSLSKIIDELIDEKLEP